MPDRRHLRSTLALAATVLGLFYLVYGGASWLTSLHGRRWQVWLPFETELPFVPAAALVYLSPTLVFLATPWVLRTWRRTVPLAMTLLAETLVGGLCFLVFPVENGFPERTASGPFAGIFRLADTLNLDHNEVPSLHVAFAFTFALAFGRGRGGLARLAWTAWAVLVAGSTLLMHEHHLVDLAAGVGLAVAGMGIVHRRCGREAFLDALRLEWICMGEFARLARRHVRYAVLFLVVCRASLFRWRRTRILRAAFCLAQHVDDVLDGDLAVPEPEAYVDELIAVMSLAPPAVAATPPGRPGEEPERHLRRTGGDRESGIAQLALYVAVELDRRATADADPKAELLQLFEVLRRDRRRMDGRLLWTAAELAEHHRRTFHLSLDLTLMLLGSRLRADDAAPLVAALGWCSPHRDLEEDLERGLVNVPLEVVDRVRRGRGEAFSEWIRDELARGRAALEESRRRLGDLADGDPGKRVIALFTAAIERYARRYERSHGEVLAGSSDPAFLLATVLPESPPWPSG